MAEVYTFEENGELFSFDINNMTVSHDEFHESTAIVNTERTRNDIC